MNIFATKILADDNVKSFIDNIKEFESAYRDHSKFQFLAIKEGDKRLIISGDLILSTTDIKIEDNIFETDSIVIVSIGLTQIADNTENFLIKLTSSGLDIFEKNYIFIPDDNISGNYDSYYDPLQEMGTKNNKRLRALKLQGNYSPNMYSKLIDWEIMSSQSPVGTLQELLSNSYLNIENVQQKVCVNILAFPIVGIQNTSIIENSVASLAISVPESLPKESASIGYTIYRDRHQIVSRGRIEHNEMDWKQKNRHKIGFVKLHIPDSLCFIRCYAVYSGVAYDNSWVFDPTKYSNPRVTTFEAFGQELDSLKEMIKDQKRIKKGKNFESLVSLLFWMMGFSVSPLDGIPMEHGASDIIVATPNEDYMVIECTTGILTNKDKLAKLHDRATSVRDNLEDSDLRGYRVLPVIITSKKRENIKSSIEQSEELGVFVITAENLFAMIEDLKGIPIDENKMFDDMWSQVQSVQKKK